MTTLVQGGLYTPCERFRKAKGWSQVRLAGKADVSAACIRELEHGHYANLTVRTLIRISSALGVSCVDLVPGLAARLEVREREEKVRPGAGNRAQARVARVKERMVEVLRERGRMRAIELTGLMREEFGMSDQQLRKIRQGLRIEPVRLRGMGTGRQTWYVELPAELRAASAS